LALVAAAAVIRTSGGGVALGVARTVLIACSLVVAALPAFVIANGLTAVADLLGHPRFFTASYFGALPDRPLAGAVGVAITGAACGWPLAGIVLTLGLRARTRSEADVAATLLPNRGPVARALMQLRIDLRRLLPYLAAGAAVIAVRTLADTASPPLLGQRAFAQEVWFAYAREGPAAGVRAALGVLIATLPLALVFVVAARRGGIHARLPDVRDAGGGGGKPGARSAPGRAGLLAAWAGVVGLTAALPIAAQLLRPHGAIRWADIISAHRGDGEMTVWIALAGGAAVALAGAGVALWTRLPPDAGWLRRGCVAGLALVAVIAWAWPPHAGAYGLAVLPAPDSPAGRDVAGVALIVAAAVTRFAGLGWLIVSVTLARIPRAERDTAAACGLGAVARLRVVAARRLVSAAVIAGAAAGLLALSEREAAEILMPPGQQTITQALFQLLHLGADSRVLGLTLLMTAGTAIAAGAVVTGMRVRHWITRRGDRSPRDSAAQP
jgi:ABC-type Fe3+ transport system permease subunit